MISRTYIVSYYTEVNDECVDREIEVDAENILEAIEKINFQVRVFKRIFMVKEKVGNSNKLLTDFEKINPPGVNGFPKITEIVSRKPFKTNRQDPNYDKPLSALEKEY